MGVRVTTGFGEGKGVKTLTSGVLKRTPGSCDARPSVVWWSSSLWAVV